VDWINVVQDSDRWQPDVYAGMNCEFQKKKKWEISCLADLCLLQ
jgi:hypothetical protein